MAIYGTLAAADTYFLTRLYVDSWTNETDANKTKALNEATQRIDRLRFAGYRVMDTQDLEFPRYYGDEADNTEIIPLDIELACYEIAFSLLDGINPETELENLRVTSHAFGVVKTTYDKDNLPDYLIAGIPSRIAWQYLLRYLDNNRNIFIHRVS
jgi:hypothetical protein